MKYLITLRKLNITLMCKLLLFMKFVYCYDEFKSYEVSHKYGFSVSMENKCNTKPVKSLVSNEILYL